MKSLLLLSIILTLSLSSCSSVPEKISRAPSYGQISTTGIGDAIYTYDKQGKHVLGLDKWMKETKTIITDSVLQELIYSGYAKGELKVTYREYVNDYARAAFSQNVSYDHTPNNNTVISFKGARIEVLEANNTQIKYKVIKGFRNEQTVAKH